MVPSYREMPPCEEISLGTRVVSIKFCDPPLGYGEGNKRVTMRKGFGMDVRRFSARIHSIISHANGGSDSERVTRDHHQQFDRAMYWRFYINLALMLIDAAMFVIAGATILIFQMHGHVFTAERFGFHMDATLYLTVAAAITVYSLYAAGVYHRHVMGDGYQLNPLLIRGSVKSWVVLCAFNFVLDLDLWLSALTFMVATAWVLIVVERIIVRMFITKSRSKGQYAYGTVVVGSPHGIGCMLKFLAKRQQLNYRPVAVCPIRFNEQTGLIEADGNTEGLKSEMLNSWGAELPVMQYEDHHLAKRMVDMGAQTVLVTDELRRYSDNYNVFCTRMESFDLEVAMIASAADTSGHEIMVRTIQGTTIITQRLAQYTPSRLIAKRIFDLIVSSLAIVVSLLITLPVAIAIKLTDGGPVFYTQTRVGLRGKPFKMIKFRSMVVNADAMKQQLAKESGQTDRFIFKMKNDPRITPVGHFIRRFSIDELPQFLNVWMGDMSVVGPRPPLPEEYARYNKVYAMRMLVKPGITGPWQVSGRSDLSAEESEMLDVSYVQSWSVMGDIVLMLRTVGAVLRHKGAY